jgi:hypothetical protein
MILDISIDDIKYSEYIEDSYEYYSQVIDLIELNSILNNQTLGQIISELYNG